MAASHPRPLNSSLKERLLPWLQIGLERGPGSPAKMKAKPISSKSIARIPRRVNRDLRRGTDQERGSARLRELTTIIPGDGRHESFCLGESASVQNASTASS